MTYADFVVRKMRKHQACGFEPTAPINPKLFEWQRKIVRWNLQQGRSAIFAECGLGKTPMQLEWATHVSIQTAKPVVILCPLAVAHQTLAEAQKFDCPVPITIVREPSDVILNGINICNYDRLEKLDGIEFGGAVLDESSVLKAFTGKMRRDLTERFRTTQYRLCCTATPSPNDFTELGQHAEFLGVCSPAEMLATWFLNDTFDTGTWRLKRHAEEDFWRWVSSWACSVTKPSDIGGSDEGFALPPVDFKIATVKVSHAAEKGSEFLFRDGTTSATTIHREMRRTLVPRCMEAVKIVKQTKGPVVVWCNTNDESDLLGEMIDDSVEVRGSMSAEKKEEALQSFVDGKTRVLVTKASIAGYGLNFQHCADMVFVGLSYSYEDLYQAVRRVWRFGQKRQVTSWLVQADTENNVLPTIKRKMEQHETMKAAMKFTAENLLKPKPSTVLNDTVETLSENRWTMHLGDCVRGITERVATETVGLSVFSPPFADLFTYSNDVQDMGNCRDAFEFMEQFRYLVDELGRVTMPGRHCAVHCCDLLSTKWKQGKIEFQDFSGSIARCFRDKGWLLHARITIWKSPVTEMQRTKAHGLLYKTLKADSADSRVGAPDYLLVFRKPGENPVPITHTEDEFPLDKWQEIASPVWWTVNQSRVLDYEVARGENDEKHICPLQLDVIERALTLWSAKDDLVLSPFSGIGSEGYCAIKMGRKFVGCELKPSYYDRAVHNLRVATEEVEQDLFRRVAK